jgi:hypothetical protein
MEVEF